MLEANIMDAILNEAGNCLNDISNAKSTKEKLEYSTILKNLMESLMYFTESITNLSDFDPEGDYID